MRRLAIAFVLLAAALLVPGTANAAPKAADQAKVLGGCEWGRCGQVINTGAWTIYAIRDFDSNGPKPGTEWRALEAGARTPPWEDWDGFYVNCDAYGQIHSWLPPNIWVSKYFSLPGAHWMKVKTNQIAEVNATC